MNGILEFVKCPILFFTGVSCPGCGLTRAWISALSGDLNSAAYYHPLFLTVPFIILMFIFEKKLPKKYIKAMSVIFITAFLAVYIIRMFSPDNTVVRFTPSEGLIGKVIIRVMEVFKNVLS